MSESWNQPPPNNAGRHIDWSDKLSPSPKKKILEFEHLKFSYDHDTGEFTVDDNQGTTFIFDVAELSELKAALITFGIGISAGTVNYR